MKIAPHAFLVAAFFVGGCADDADPWLAYRSVAAEAAPGRATVIATHVDLGPDCAVRPAPRLAIVEDGTLGALSFSPATRSAGDAGGPCAGVAAPATAVTYAAGPVAGTDRVVYRELRAPPLPDVIHTASVRVR